jgi:hypothetical protein
MPFVPVNDTIEAEVRMLLDNQKIENTLYFKKSGGWDIASATGIGNDILLWWTTLYSVFVSSAVTLREIYITDLETPTGFTVTIPAPAPAPAGARGAAALPNNVCLTVSFRTNARGRSFRGRNYISGFAEDQVVLNTVDSGTLSDIVDGYEGLFTVASDATSSWVVVSRFSGVDTDGEPIPRLSGLTTNISAVLIVDAIVDSQRRRLPTRGQ